MIRAKKGRHKGEYMIFKPQMHKTKVGDLWRFSIMDTKYDGIARRYKTQGFVNCATFGDEIVLHDREKIIIKEITGISMGKYTTTTGQEVVTTTVFLDIVSSNNEVANDEDEDVNYVADEDINLPF